MKKLIYRKGGYVMDMDNNIIKVINDNLMKNSEFEFIAGLEDVTISDIDCIEEFSAIKNIKSKFNYQIIDNTYIKIRYSL